MVDGKDCHCQCKCCNGTRSNKYYVSRLVRLSLRNRTYNPFTHTHIQSIHENVHSYIHMHIHKHTHTHTNTYVVPMNTYWPTHKLLAILITICIHSKKSQNSILSFVHFFSPFISKIWLCSIQKRSADFDIFMERHNTFKRCR